MSSVHKPTTFASSISILHVSTATAVLTIDGVNFLLDPAFDAAGTEYDAGVVVLKRLDAPAIGMEHLPPIDAVLLSHEDHADNLDPSGRTLLNGRRVFTTQDGAKKLAPRPGVQGMSPWETIEVAIAGKTFRITATPCVHLPGGECIGFIIECDSFGVDDNGLPHIVYVSGDTVYVADVALRLRKDYNVVLAVLNVGAATVTLPTGPMLLTLNGEQAVQLTREIDANVVVPLHYESWSHFAEGKKQLEAAFLSENAKDIRHKLLWLEPGKDTKVL